MPFILITVIIIKIAVNSSIVSSRYELFDGTTARGESFVVSCASAVFSEDEFTSIWRNVVEEVFDGAAG